MQHGTGSDVWCVHIVVEHEPADAAKSLPENAMLANLFGKVMPRAVSWQDDGAYGATLVKTENYSGLHYHEDHGCFELIKKSS